MREDLDRLMDERGVDWAFVMGAPHETPEMFYMTSGAGVTHAYVVKQRGAEPVLLHGSMERDEARGSGLMLKSFNDFDLQKLRKEAKTTFEYQKRLVHAIFDSFGVTGKVGFYGRAPIQWAVPLVEQLVAERGDIQVADEASDDVFTIARRTKDAQEVDRIAAVGDRTVEVIEGVKERLRKAELSGGMLHEDGAPLTIGAVHAQISLELARRHLLASEGTVFAQGRDAGVPHSRGTAKDPIRAGLPIVFDIFPCELGGGYFHDITRTYVVGEPAPGVRDVYEAVREVHELALRSVQPGMAARELDAIVCDAFEARDYATVRKDPKTETGYVHSLGHGVGLDIHEHPGIRDVESNTDRLTPGMVFTIEPGLYFPDREIGVRIEDTCWLDFDGKLHVLTRTSKDLVL